MTTPSRAAGAPRPEETDGVFDDDKNCHHAKFPETALEIVSVEEMGE